MRSLLRILLALTGALAASAQPRVVVLGTTQDGGLPHAGCRKNCCRAVASPRLVSSLGIFDSRTGEEWLLDATPNFSDQLRILQNLSGDSSGRLDGIFLTHAHIGHYTGLMALGREMMNASSVPVYAMPRMSQFLSGNGPWSQLVALQNIRLVMLQDGLPVAIRSDMSVQPLLVPHRDEYSETVGFLVRGPTKSLLFIPDIDKWEKWQSPIEAWIRRVDYAFLDGTFFREGEIPGRSMSEIPHPFIEETMKRLDALPVGEKKKVYFIHMNHTNPVLSDGVERQSVVSRGYRVAETGMVLDL